MVKNRALLPWWFIGISKARFVVKAVIYLITPRRTGKSKLVFT